MRSVDTKRRPKTSKIENVLQENQSKHFDAMYDRHDILKLFSDSQDLRKITFP